MADSKKYNGSTWEHSLRKLTTATEAVENPLYSDGTAITSYTISGNTVQNGTPTPSNPVDVNGVGVRTENLLDWSSFADDYYLDINSGLPVTYTSSLSRIATLTPIDVSNYNNVTFAFELEAINKQFIYSLFNGTTLVRRVAGNGVGATIDTSDGDKLYICIYSTTNSVTTSNVSQAMLNTGSTAKPYEPYGYKIPISNGQQTTNIYLGSTQTTRQIKKLVFTGQENWLKWQSTTIYFMNMSGYMLAEGDITQICTHYQPYEQTSVSSVVPDGYCAFRSIDDSSKRILISDSNCANANKFKDYLTAQYIAGTPVTIWYALATPETATVNEPLMKIGDYADTLSNAAQIPTTEGANSITVGTTVQPSEFTATWTGLHNASVKEWDGSDWQ